MRRNLLWLPEAWRRVNFRFLILFFSYENLNCRHHVLTALGIPSLKQHQMTPATDRDHPPHSGCHLHHTHPRLISQILHFPDNFMWWRTDSEACLLYFVAGFQRSFIPVSTQFSAFSPFLSCLGQLWFWTPFYASSCNVLIAPQTYPSSCNVLIVPQTYPPSCDVWVGFIVYSLHLIQMKLLANYIHCQCPIFSLKYSDLSAWFWLYFFQYAAIYQNERIFNIPRSIFHINCMSLSWRIHHILHLYWENSNLSWFTFPLRRPYWGCVYVVD